MSQAQSILLESGTNELEIVTYTVGENLFSINVMKVREIINPFPVTTVPESHHAVEGVVQVRGEILPVINLATALNLKSTKPLDQTKFIISELNQMKVIFRVDEVHRIQRISWEQIDEPASLSMGLEETTSGIVKLDGKIILLLDYEKIVCEISNTGYDNKSLAGLEQKTDRAEKVIYIAEDSAMLRQILEETLSSAGYTKMNFFSNGAEALAQIEKLAKEQGEKMFEHIHLLITDIEMPKMDGHHLTKVIKDSEIMNRLPVVIFSSLITNELFHKGEAVGANAQVSKPDIQELIGLVDKLVL
ncbi:MULTISPECIES: chemotaxis protein [Bacillus cereus group]|uniref:Chemotaxis protein n=1 Tax=Bacillus thuringiensis TaxID=1428 RepID=A0A1C4C5S9_BACTU|nr:MULTISPECIES: chemotaxis protein [Bacillus cereus group]MDP1456683.1 chemotaxis protein [Bacillus wiedmannii]MED2013957.1 chemotaxis protein [Bacillus wiedmannii]MED3023801.1 chemotaxis protein [Bacillus wiedmannii]OTX97156.1 chemotaxis protein CheV [Bacillus thuringiensis serovar wratislaviensis]OUB55375.1 chemotaxis protein CheV [Bacillus thuringiensis serovar sylvestriensis]